MASTQKHPGHQLPGLLESVRIYVEGPRMPLSANYFCSTATFCSTCLVRKPHQKGRNVSCLQVVSSRFLARLACFVSGNEKEGPSKILGRNFLLKDGKVLYYL
jgi:hypothetical protein